jgi:3-hydroxyacyl-CoA dehydrogenase
MSEIKTVGIIGFGVMGAAIGLNAAASGYRVIYKEINDDLVKTMYEKQVVRSLSKRVEKGKITQEDMDRITANISGTTEYADLTGCDLIIEAAVENMDLKIGIFKDLSDACPKETIIVSNTSTFLIEKLMEKVDNPARTAGLHYFFPANVNKLVEVIRQKETSDDTYQALMSFAKGNKKVPITVKDFPGFAINPIFISAYLILDTFYGDTYNAATLDDISKEALGIKYGVLWVQNSGGLGTAYHAGKSMVDYLGNSDIGFPPVPDVLGARFENNDPFNLEDGPVLDDEKARAEVKETLLGGIYAISTHLIENDVASMGDLDLGISTALAWPKGPLTMMNEMGMEEAARLIKTVVDKGFYKMPKKFASGDLSPWKM